MRSLLSPSIAALALLATTSSVAVAAPLSFTHQGRLFNAAGDPLTGSHAIAFSLHDAPSGGATLWSEPHSVQFDNGYYAVVLGSSSPLDPADFASDDVYLGMAVDGAPQLARLQLHSVPWALRADTATNVDGGIVNASEIRINGNTVIDASGTSVVDWSDLSGVPADFADGSDDGWAPPTCTTNQELVFNGTAWACQGKNAHQHDAADLTSGTIAMARLNVGNTPGTLAAGDHEHNGVEALSCSVGQLPVFDGSAWACVADNAHAHNGLETLSCGAGKLPEYDGSTWTCVDGDAHAHNGVEALSCAAGELAEFDGSNWGCVKPSSGGGSGALLFRYDLDETSTTYLDTSGNGNDATTNGAGLAFGSAGHSGRAVNFTGGIASVAPDNTIFSSPNVTVEAWVRPALPTDGTQTILEKEGAWVLTQTRGSSNSVATVSFKITSAKSPATTCTATSQYVVSAGAWAHVSGSYNGRTVSVSVNDNWIEVACDQGPIATTTGTPLNIGAASANANPYNGLIDEVRGWATAVPSSYLNYGGMFEGTTLIDSQQMARLNEWSNRNGQRWTLCYKRSRDGASSATFHVNCDNQGATMTIMQLATGKLMGGYAEPPWNDNNNTYLGYGSDSFLFSLTADTKYPVGGYFQGNEIYNHTSYCPAFGNGHDFYTDNGCQNLHCNFPYYYSQNHQTYGADRNIGCQELVGANSGALVTISEMEVYVQAFR